MLRAEIAMTSNRGRSAPQLLLKAARQLEPLDTQMARDAYLQALSVAMSALPAESGGIAEVAAAACAAPPAPDTPRPTDLLLDALTLYYTEDAAVAAPAMRQALNVFLRGEVSATEEFRWLWAAYFIAVGLWDDNACRELADRYVGLVRDSGALALLPLALSLRTTGLYFGGELDEAASMNEEIQAFVAASEIRTSYGVLVRSGGSLALAAFQGRRAEAEQLTDSLMTEAMPRGEGSAMVISQWLSAVLYNSLGRYKEALAAAQRASGDWLALGAGAHWAPAELVEAASRCDEPEIVSRALERLVQTTQASQTDWARGLEARSRALISEDERADHLYREAIDRLQRTRMRVDLARAHLVYGEWLRRERRRLEAREQLRTASKMFTDMGMDGFADRAARELLATGETVRKRNDEDASELTPQETQIARLARNGLTNKEIASRLYVSPRTVEYHLHKVFAKQGITSRNQLRRIP